MRGAFHRLRDPFQGNEAAWMVVAADRSEALVVHVNVQVEANVITSLLRLPGLEAEAAYTINGIGSPMRGDTLMNAGLLVLPPSGDFFSQCWHLRRTNR